MTTEITPTGGEQGLLPLQLEEGSPEIETPTPVPKPKGECLVLKQMRLHDQIDTLITSIAEEAYECGAEEIDLDDYATRYRCQRLSEILDFLQGFRPDPRRALARRLRGSREVWRYQRYYHHPKLSEAHLVKRRKKAENRFKKDMKIMMAELATVAKKEAK